MTNHEFAFVLSGVDPHAQDFEDRFFDAGCDDATLVLMHSAVAACFNRHSDTYESAVLSAYEDVLRAGADVLRFEPDFLVSASEIASRAGLSRSAISLYEKGERAKDYPRPFARVTTKSPLWDWVEVSHWLVVNGKLPEDEYRSAQVSRIINHNVQVHGDLAKAKADVKSALSQPIAA